MSADATDWFIAVKKRLEIAGKELVPREKWAAAANDNDSKCFAIPRLDEVPP